MVSRDVDDFWNMQVWEKEEETETLQIFFSQELLEIADQMHLNTEYQEPEYVTIQGHPGVRYVTPWETGFFWTDDKYAYDLSGNCEEDVLRDVMNHIRVTDGDGE